MSLSERPEYRHIRLPKDVQMKLKGMFQDEAKVDLELIPFVLHVFISDPSNFESRIMFRPEHQIIEGKETINITFGNGFNVYYFPNGESPKSFEKLIYNRNGYVPSLISVDQHPLYTELVELVKSLKE